MALEFLTPLGPSSSLLVLLALLSSMFLWTQIRRPYSAYSIPPYPEPPQFIVGHLLKFKTNTQANLRKWRESAGDIFSLDFGGRLFVVVNGYEHIREALVKQADKLTDRIHIKGANANAGIFQASGAIWKEERSVCLSILRDLGMGKNHIMLKIQEEVEAFVEKLACFRGEPMDIRSLTNLSVSNIICAIIFGHRFEYEDPKFIQLNDAFTDVLTYGSSILLLDRFPFLQYLPFDLFGILKYRKATWKVKVEFSLKYTELIRKALDEGDTPQNFIAAYLQEMKKKERLGEASYLHKKQLISTIKHLFAAGSTTTSAAIIWAIVYMLHHPDMQEKIYREIEDVVGLVRVPNLLDKSKTPYLNAVLMETQRIASIVPISPPRLVSQDIQIGGYHIPKGSAVFMNLHSALMEEKIWSDPGNFRPERFLNSDGTLARVPEEFIPFSIGKRNCLGESMAKMQLYLFLSALFQRFEFKPAGELPDLEGSYGVTHVAKPFQVHIKDRRR